MAERILIRGGFVLTMDPSLGDQPGADVLIEGDKIAAVGRNLSAEGAQVIDATGDIVIPGFVDTHRHTWEAPIRSSAPNYTLGDYFVGILDSFAPKYRPQDVYAGNLWGALECVNAGITTLLDWSHIANTPEHADEAIRGLKDVGSAGGLRLRLPEHVARRLVVQQQADPARGRAPHPQASTSPPTTA